MKTVSLAVSLAVSLTLTIAAGCSIAAAQQSKKPPKSPGKQSALSGSYAKAALSALKAIETDDTVPHMENEKPVGNPDTLAAINAATAQGKTPAEDSATDALNTIYTQRLLDNNRRDTKRMTYESDSGLEDEGSREMTAQQRMQSDAELINAEQAEKACFDAMETTLQSRYYVAPPACLSWSPALKALQKSQ